MSWVGPFTIRARMGDRDVAVTWDKGRLSGTPEAVRAVEEVLAGRETIRLNPQDADRPARLDEPNAS